ncbi:unnamed protein product [Prunus armeniaca]
MAEKILEYRATLPDQLKNTFASILAAQKPVFLNGSDPGTSRAPNSEDGSWYKEPPFGSPSGILILLWWLQRYLNGFLCFCGNNDRNRKACVGIVFKASILCGSDHTSISVLTHQTWLILMLCLFCHLKKGLIGGNAYLRDKIPLPCIMLFEEWGKSVKRRYVAMLHSNTDG